jgi:hypothetical protein
MLELTIYRQPIRASLREVKYIGKVRRDMGRHMKDGPSSSESRSIPYWASPWFQDKEEQENRDGGGDL